MTPEVRWVARAVGDEIAWVEAEVKEQRNGWKILRIVRASDKRVEERFHAATGYRLMVERAYESFDKAMAAVKSDAWGFATEAQERATEAMARAERIQRLATEAKP